MHVCIEGEGEGRREGGLPHLQLLFPSHLVFICFFFLLQLVTFFMF